MREPFRLRLPSGRLDVLQLHADTAGWREIMDGKSHWCGTKHEPGNYLVRLWPVTS